MDPGDIRHYFSPAKATGTTRTADESEPPPTAARRRLDMSSASLPRKPSIANEKEVGHPGSSASSTSATGTTTSNSVVAANVSTPTKRSISTMNAIVTPTPTKMQKTGRTTAVKGVIIDLTGGDDGDHVDENDLSDRGNYVVGKHKVVDQPEKEVAPETWLQRRETILKKYPDNKYLLKHSLGQLQREQEMASAVALRKHIKSDESSQNPPSEIRLSAEQRFIANHPADTPLSVRAGAGTGKTQTMVSRAIQLVTKHEVDASKILMLTFTNKAASEMRERIGAEFVRNKEVQQYVMALPTCKTFHSLAFRWIRAFWRSCGLRCYPSILATKPQQKKFMEEVIQHHVRHLQLKRCYKYLGWANDDDPSWETAIRTIQERYPKAYDAACTKAKEKIAPKTKPKKTAKIPSPTKKKSSKQLESEKRQEAELELRIKSEVHRQAYLELRVTTMQQTSAKPSDLHRQSTANSEMQQPAEVYACDLEHYWTASKDQVDRYQALVENARLGQHDPSEYLPKDEALLRFYEQRQEETGQIDFDQMLILFVHLLRDNDIKNEFHRVYDYVIVDEYQDNSKVQSNLLLEIVNKAKVTVVGDDDQCIYEFRGASPGNFDAFKQHFSPAVATSGGKASSVTEATLEENYRSTANILRVAAKLLERSNKRYPKTLRPTRENGQAVELWKCANAAEQAQQIALSIKSRQIDGVSWRDVACLFRCFRMGPQASLHYALQQQLAVMNIPFKVVGGQSFLASEMVSDILAYMSLTLTGHPTRIDDRAFVRVLNKPPRGIGAKFMDLIKAQKSAMEDETSGNVRDDGRHPAVGLEEAATTLSKEAHVLTDKQKLSLERFFNLIDELRIAANGTALPELVLLIWEKTGLARWHARKKNSKSESNNDLGESGEDDEANDDDGDNDNVRKSTETAAEKEIPYNVRALLSIAEAHTLEWAEPPESDVETKVDSLFNITKKFWIGHCNKIPAKFLPQLHLPQVYIDELHLPGGIGLAVVNSFVVDLTLQSSNTEEAESCEDDDKVTISTIHRAKGLEWSEVYIPFFNQGYMPTNFREDKNSHIPARHLPGCQTRGTSNCRDCDKNCARHFSKSHREQRGMTLEQAHDDEERRLAHVAATRAKYRLVFASTNESSSSYEDVLRELPESVFQKKQFY